MIWNQPIDKALVVRRWDKRFWSYNENSHDRIKLFLDVIGFGSVAKAGYYILDHSLIMALIERWRPETHTFHFSCSEAIVTLEDVALLWGLPIDGLALTGGKVGGSQLYWQRYIERFLGYQPRVDAIDGNFFKKSSLEDFLSTELAPEATEEQLHQRARGLALYLIGGMLFTNHSGMKVHLRYLTHLENLTEAGNFNWGSGVLAYLYRSMCLASRGDAQEVCGPLVLLQLWAWERIPICRPYIPVIEDRVIPEMAPLGAHWNYEFDLTRLSTHVLLACRDQFDSMSSDHFVWMLYTDRVIPERYMAGRRSWGVKVPIICWEIVERHCLERVTRQFGIIQEILEQPQAWHEDTHKCELRGNTGMDWSSYLRRYIELWDTRLDRVVD